MRDFRSRGFVLPLLLLLLLAFTAFGHGVLLLSRRELQSAWAYRHFARAEAAAGIGLRLAWEMGTDSTSLSPRWSEAELVRGRTRDGLTYRGTLRWLDSEFFLVEGIGGSEGWLGEQRIASLGWTLAPAVRVCSFLSPSDSGDSAGTGPFLGSEATSRPTGWPASACRPYQADLDSLSEAGRGESSQGGGRFRLWGRVSGSELLGDLGRPSHD